jgi:hypothetical protein
VGSLSARYQIRHDRLGKLTGTLAGCQFFQVLTTRKIEPQANPKDEVYLQLLVANNKGTPAWLDTTIAKTCASQRKADLVPAIWAPIAKL